MTDNEKKAREILDLSFGANVGTNLTWCIKKLGGDLPELTYDECLNIACNYPVAVVDIRSSFPCEGSGFVYCKPIHAAYYKNVKNS